jgi:hypothetical protein
MAAILAASSNSFMRLIVRVGILLSGRQASAPRINLIQVRASLEQGDSSKDGEVFLFGFIVLWTGAGVGEHFSPGGGREARVLRKV